MIVDQIQNWNRYASLHAGFAKAFEFLSQPNLVELPPGRHVLDGDMLFAIVSRDEGRGKEESPLEAHRRYIDIQFVVDGDEKIGWVPTAHCQRVAATYDEERDIEFFYDRPETWLSISNGEFAVFFPSDAHAPLAGQGSVHKIVCKIAV